MLRKDHAVRRTIPAVIALLSGVVPIAVVDAQVGSVGGPSGPALAPPSIGVETGNVPLPGPAAENAMSLGDWLVYPTIFGGISYNTNVDQSPTNAISSAGVRLVPSLLAERTNGISNTTLYGMADGLFDFDQRAANANTLSARLGSIESYEPVPDWAFTAQLDYTRQYDLFSTFGLSQDIGTLNPTGVGIAPVANPEPYNQFSATASGHTDIGSAFLNFGGSVVGIVYDNTTFAAPAPNGVVYTGFSRGGLWLTPDLFGYVEGSADVRDYAEGGLSSHGYRVIGGLGSGSIGLVRGEIYGGFQSEAYDSVGIGTVNSPAFGAKLYYYPLPELTFDAVLDNTLGASLLTPTATTPGSPTRVTSLLAQARYAIAPEWTASLRGGYVFTDYVGTPRRDDAWMLEFTGSYSVWQNLSLTLDFEHVGLVSNVPLQGFTQNVVTIGVSYKY